MSFFGYDTSQPRNPKHKKAQDYDEILEAKYKYAQDVSGELEDDDPELNDVTFDTDPTQMSNTS
jgi:hypothetical protein